MQCLVLSGCKMNQAMKNYLIKGMTYCRMKWLQQITGSARLSRELHRGVHSSASPPWRVMFFGTDRFAATHLTALHRNQSVEGDRAIEKLSVVVPCKKCEVERYAVSEDLPLYHWPLPDVSGQFDVGVIVSFGHLIPDKVIRMFPRGMINIHASLLPQWRGASPILHSILAGDKLTGVSIIQIRPDKFDVGPLLAQETVPVPDQCTSVQLSEILAQKGSDMMIQCLRHLDHIPLREQETSKNKLTYAHKFSNKHTQVNWDCTMDAIGRQYRSLGVLHHLCTQWNDTKIRLFDMVSLQEMADERIQSVLSPLSDSGPGRPVYVKAKELLAVKCKDGWVGFRGIVIRKPMSAKAFHNGHLSKERNKNIDFVSLPTHLDKYLMKPDTS